MTETGKASEASSCPVKAFPTWPKLVIVGSTRGVFRASDARKGVCWGFLGVPMVFFELETQEKECVGGSWACPRRSSSFRRKKKSVLGVLGRARSVSRVSDARKGMCSGFLGAPAAFFELQIQEKERVGGSRACSRRVWDARFTWSSSWRGKSREAPDPGLLQPVRGCPGLLPKMGIREVNFNKCELVLV